jgi:hypothetical protein
MAAITYEITANGSALAEFTTLTLNKGRQQVQDPFKAGTASVTGLDISTVSGLDIGDRLTIKVVAINGTTVSYTLFDGQIANITADFGFTTNMDRWTIEADDSLAAAGRIFMSNFFVAGMTTGVASSFVAQATGIDVFQPFPVAAESKVSTQSFDNENLLTVLNKLIATEQGRLVPVNPDNMQFYNRNTLNIFGTLCNFTDGTVASALPAVKYQQIVFRSRSESFYTKVIVEPEGLASQTSGTGSRVFTMQTYDQTTAQASDLAAYVLATLDVSQDVPASISYIAENQATASVQYAVEAATFLTLSASNSILLTLRGTQYSCFVEGFTVSANPDQTRFTLNLSSSEATVGFILDDADFGVLDQNKLGF